MRIVVALGGNALLKRGEPMTDAAQRANVAVAAIALAELAKDHQIVIAHGNGPQVGLLALQGAAYAPDTPWPLDVLGAESEGMIGYLIEQELINALPAGAECATLLTRVEVDADDPAFKRPTKPIGPVYTEEQADKLRETHPWTLVAEGQSGFRRVVPSPAPMRILGLKSIRLLVDSGITVICAGGGGIPVVRRADASMQGIEAVIDKDRTSALLAEALGADALLMLTDVASVYRAWGTPEQAAIDEITPAELDAMDFAEGSMGPKVAAASSFVLGGGRLAGIGRLQDARAIIESRAGTRIRPPGRQDT
ncbi:carbamate kinase [Hoeflea marina]|uniref:Carbamate kinase n=1 Tax=Hoeflea marina TaxID=274592 RepID=A0A317PYG5_9HYPH|nr:carbamate kinase [Hoeflea marina]PWW04550.1 carbamate kinase [Hoeflea marina]